METSVADIMEQFAITTLREGADSAPIIHHSVLHLSRASRTYGNAALPSSEVKRLVSVLGLCPTGAPHWDEQCGAGCHTMASLTCDTSLAM